MLERSAPFFVFPFAPFEGAEEGAESTFLPASNTISITLLLASRLVAETARVYTSTVIREFAWRRSSCAVLRSTPADRRLPCELFGSGYPRFIFVCFVNLDIQRAFQLAFRTEKESVVMHAPFNVLPAEWACAMSTDMNTKERLAGGCALCSCRAVFIRSIHSGDGDIVPVRHAGVQRKRLGNDAQYGPRWRGSADPCSGCARRW